MTRAATVTGALVGLIVLVAALTPGLERATVDVRGTQPVSVPAVVGATAPSLQDVHPTSTPGGA